MPLCENPWMVGIQPTPCGDCAPCRNSRKSIWGHRLILEATQHEYSSFVTLTYNEDSLRFQNPKTGDFGFPTLYPDDLKNFIKRLRRAVAPTRLRYYACGEYGDRNWRPHYHIALFGYEPCYRGRTRRDKHAKGSSCCPPCDLVRDKWSHPKTKQSYGGIEVAPLNEKTANYVAGYVTKKLTAQHDSRLQGRFPEFQRQSNRPGIAGDCVETLADALFSQYGKNMLTEHGDVPAFLNRGKYKVPLGRYLRDKLRDAIGMDDETRQEIQKQYQEELLLMWLSHLKDPDVPQEKKTTFKQYILAQDKQKILNFKAKQLINKKRRNLNETP